MISRGRPSFIQKQGSISKRDFRNLSTVLHIQFEAFDCTTIAPLLHQEVNQVQSPILLGNGAIVRRWSGQDFEFFVHSLTLPIIAAPVGGSAKAILAGVHRVFCPGYRYP